MRLEAELEKDLWLLLRFSSASRSNANRGSSDKQNVGIEMVIMTNTDGPQKEEEEE
jgi:hypothetical protein